MAGTIFSRTDGSGGRDEDHHVRAISINPQHGGRQGCHTAGIGGKHFNPRPPRGGRLCAASLYMPTSSFQPTPSAWRATARCCDSEYPAYGHEKVGDLPNCFPAAIFNGKKGCEPRSWYMFALGSHPMLSRFTFGKPLAMRCGTYAVGSISSVSSPASSMTSMR